MNKIFKKIFLLFFFTLSFFSFAYGVKASTYTCQNSSCYCDSNKKNCVLRRNPPSGKSQVDLSYCDCGLVCAYDDGSVIVKVLASGQKITVASPYILQTNQKSFTTSAFPKDTCPSMICRIKATSDDDQYNVTFQVGGCNDQYNAYIKFKKELKLTCTGHGSQCITTEGTSTKTTEDIIEDRKEAIDNGTLGDDDDSDKKDISYTKFNLGDIDCDTFFKDESGNYNRLYYMLQNIFDIIQYSVIAIVLGFTIFDFVKAITSGDKDATKKAGTKAIKRLIIGILIFFLPIIVNFIITLITKYTTCNLV